MRTPIGPDGPTNPSHGPLCYHSEAMVLRTLNGRNVYVCSRYPHHHCRACCPVDVMLMVDEAPAPAETTPQPLPFGSPIQGSPMMMDQNDPMAASPPHPDAGAAAAASPSPGRTTPTAGLPPRPPRPPSAPTKSQHSGGGSVTSRAGGATSAAVRSLTPIFNGFAPAASRFNELGGRFAVMRPQASAIARMQRQMSGSQDSGSPPGSQATPATAAAVAGRKRGREEEGGQGPAPSVRTVSRGKEPRSAAWILRSPDFAAPEGHGQ